METSTALLIGGAVIIGAIVWKRFGAARQEAGQKNDAATAGANRVASAIDRANDTIRPVLSGLPDALKSVAGIFDGISGSNQNRYPDAGPGGAQIMK